MLNMEIISTTRLYHYLLSFMSFAAVFSVCSLIASFQIPVVISKCIHNNGPLNWKSINMQVIIKSPGWPLPEPTMCLIFIWFSQLFISVEHRPMHRELGALPRKISERTKVQKHELAW